MISSKTPSYADRLFALNRFRRVLLAGTAFVGVTLAGPAWAVCAAGVSGVAGGAGAGSTGGAGGSVVCGKPGAGSAGVGTGAGAGGAAGTSGSNYTTGATINGTVTGGAGGKGGANDGSGTDAGGGGAGGTGASVSAAITLSNSGTLTGGAGGNVSTAPPVLANGTNGGGGGGAGGIGLFVWGGAATITTWPAPRSKAAPAVGATAATPARVASACRSLAARWTIPAQSPAALPHPPLAPGFRSAVAEPAFRAC